MDLNPGQGYAMGLAYYLLPKPRLGCISPGVVATAFYREIMPQVYAPQTLSQAIDRIAGKVQFVYANGYFNHLPALSLSDTLSNIRKLLSPTGVLVCEVPDAAHAAAVESRGRDDRIAFTRSGLIDMLRTSGFEIKQCLNVAPDEGSPPSDDPQAERGQVGAGSAAFNARIAALTDPTWRGSRWGKSIRCVAIAKGASNVAQGGD